MNAKPGMSDANPLVKLTWIASCMKRKGWEPNPDSKLAQDFR